MRISVELNQELAGYQSAFKKQPKQINLFDEQWETLKEEHHGYPLDILDPVKCTYLKIPVVISEFLFEVCELQETANRDKFSIAGVIKASNLQDFYNKKDSKMKIAEGGRLRYGY